MIPTAFFIPSGSALNLSKILPINSSAGVSTLANNSPIGAIDAFNLSTDPINLFIGESD